MNMFKTLISYQLLVSTDQTKELHQWHSFTLGVLRVGDSPQSGLTGVKPSLSNNNGSLGSHLDLDP